MTVTLKPVGRGRWTPLVMQLSGRAAREGGLLILPGQRITLGGIVFRIVGVQP